MARISLDPPRTLRHRALAWWCRRIYGTELDPVRALGHSPRTQTAFLVHELAVGRARDLDARLRSLAVMASAHVIGCTWCTDFGYWLSHTDGIEEETLRTVPTWREAPGRFSPLERQVMDYAEAMSRTPMEVTDAMVTELEAALGTPALVDLTMMVAVENQRSRFNGTMGLSGQGFVERCAVREDVRG